MLLKNLAGVAVWILSVDATPVNPVPSPTKLDAVTIPEKVALPLADMVAAVPTLSGPVCKSIAEKVPIPAVRLPLEYIVAAEPTRSPSVSVATPDAIFKPRVVICIPLVAVIIPV